MLVAALLAATIVVALPREETPGGTIDTEAFSDRENVKYSLNVIYEFRDYITTFQGNLINGILLFFGVEPVRGELSGALIADMITDFYSAAGIPAEKLLNFGELLASYTAYEIYTAGFDTVKFFVDITPITEEQAEETYVECSNCGELHEGEYTVTAGADGAEDVYSCNKCSAEGAAATVGLKHRYTSSEEWYCPVCDEYLGMPDLTEVSGSDTDEKIYVCKDCGNVAEKRLVSVAYSSIQTLAAKLSTANPWAMWRIFAEKTMLSTEETARLIYQAVYTLRDEADREIMDSFGRTRFSNLLVSAITIAEGISGFKDGGGSLIEARALAALAYEAGTALNDVIAEVGADTFLEAFGFKGYSAEVDIIEIIGDRLNTDALAAVEEFNDVMETADTVTEFLLEVATGALLASDTPMFDAVYYATTATDEEEIALYRDFYTLQIAKCLNAGLTRAYNAGNGIGSSAEAAEKLAVLFEKLSGLEHEDREFVSKNELQYLFDTAVEISRITAVTAEDVATLSAADRGSIAAFGDFAEALIDSGKLSGGLDIFASTFVANVIYDVVTAAADDVTTNN